MISHEENQITRVLNLQREQVDQVLLLIITTIHIVSEKNDNVLIIEILLCDLLGSVYVAVGVSHKDGLPSIRQTHQSRLIFKNRSYPVQ